MSKLVTAGVTCTTTSLPDIDASNEYKEDPDRSHPYSVTYTVVPS